MAEKKFAGINGPVIDEAVTADYEQARVFDGFRAGNLGVYYREGLKLRFLAYELMDRVFIRVQEVNGKLCCGNSVLQYFRLVFVKDGKEYPGIMNENEKDMDEALAFIAAKAPNLKIGFEKKEG